MQLADDDDDAPDGGINTEGKAAAGGGAGWDFSGWPMLLLLMPPVGFVTIAQPIMNTYAYAHALTHSRTHALTHPRTHAPTHSRTHALTHSRTHGHTHIHRTQPYSAWFTPPQLVGSRALCR